MQHQLEEDPSSEKRRSAGHKLYVNLLSEVERRFLRLMTVGNQSTENVGKAAAFDSLSQQLLVSTRLEMTTEIVYFPKQSF